MLNTFGHASEKNPKQISGQISGRNSGGQASNMASGQDSGQDFGQGSGQGSGQGLGKTHNGFSFSFKRLCALCRKEAFQIARDPSSLLIAFVIPVVLLVIFGYGINFDSAALRVGLVLEDQSADARHFAQAFEGSPFIEATVSNNREDLIEKMQAGKLRGIVVVPVNFSRKLQAAGSNANSELAQIQVITDGSEPNTANFVTGYVTGVWQVWLNNEAQDAGTNFASLIDVETRYWFNQAAVSRNYIVPGAISVIITVVGAILTSLVVAREWERGTMEALLSTQITKAEFLLSKFIPYYLLGMFALLVCMLFSNFLLEVPFRGSYLLLWLVSSLFLANTLGIGLLLSTVTRSQFDAAQVALNVAFLPAVMLSGFVFEIDSMPILVKAATYLIPARYYVTLMHTLFLAGNIPIILLVNSLFLFCTGTLLLALTTFKTRMRLD